MVKKLVFGGLALAAAAFAGEQLVAGSRDLARYNKMRAMSGDPPLGVPTHRAATNAQARTSNPFAMLASLPADLAHYVRMKTM